MAKKISGYTNTRTVYRDEDLFDVSATDDGGSSFESQKTTYANLKAKIINSASGSQYEVAYLGTATSLDYNSQFTFDPTTYELVIDPNSNVEYGIELSNNNSGAAVFSRFKAGANGGYIKTGVYGSSHAYTDLASKAVLESSGIAIDMALVIPTSGGGGFEFRSGTPGSTSRLMRLTASGSLILDNEPSLDNTEDDLLAIDSSGNVVRRKATSIGITVGSTNQIPYSNTGTPGTDFNYTPNFTFNGSQLWLGTSNRIQMSFGYMDIVRGTNTFQLDGAVGGVGANGAAIVSSNFLRLHAQADSTQLLLDSSGNVGIMAGTSLSARLHVKGAGTTSATYALKVNDSALTPLFEIRDDGAVGFFGVTPTGQSAAYTRNATAVEDRTLLASASATVTNNNNVLAALIADLQAIGILG